MNIIKVHSIDKVYNNLTRKQSHQNNKKEIKSSLFKELLELELKKNENYKEN